MFCVAECVSMKLRRKVPMLRYFRLCILACVVSTFTLLSVGGASAQRRSRTAPAEVPPPPPAEESAMHYFELATEEYRTGLYMEAAAHLEQALVLDPEAPVLLFNLGRVYELMNRYDDAMSCFERLLAVTPQEATADRARTEEAIARIRGARERAQLAEAQRATEQAAEPPRVIVREHGVMDEAFWGVLIAGGVVTLGAVAVGVVSLVQRDSLGARPLTTMFTYDQYRMERESILTLGLVADITGAVGAATIAGALLLFGLREREIDLPVSVTPSTSGLQLNVQGVF